MSCHLCAPTCLCGHDPAAESATIAGLREALQSANAAIRAQSRRLEAAALDAELLRLQIAAMRPLPGRGPTLCCRCGVDPAITCRDCNREAMARASNARAVA